MVPNWILEDNTLNTYEFRILTWIIRQTIGYGKKSDMISVSQFVNNTGISKSTVLKTLELLNTKGYIHVVKKTKPNGLGNSNRYSLNAKKNGVPQTPNTKKNGVPQTPNMVCDTDIQKKERIEKEGESFIISEEEKRSFIDHLKQTEENIRNPSAYEKKIRTQLNKNDDATIEMFHQWKEQQERAKAIQSFKRQYIGSVIHKETDNGVIHGRIVEVTDSGDGGYVITIDAMGKGITRLRANDLEQAARAVANKT